MFIVFEISFFARDGGAPIVFSRNRSLLPNSTPRQPGDDHNMKLSRCRWKTKKKPMLW